MQQQPTLLDVPLITEATKEFYRQVYGNDAIGHLFKGVNMVLLRRHFSYFIVQLAAFDTPINVPQIDFLRKVHGPVIEERGATQRHFDILVSLLMLSLRSCGAQGTALLMLQSKLRPLRDIFPLHAAAAACRTQSGSSLNSVDGTIMLQEGSNRETQHAHNHKQQHQEQQQQQCLQQFQLQHKAPAKQLLPDISAASQLPLQSPGQQQEQQRGPSAQLPGEVTCAAYTPLPGAGQQQQYYCQVDKQGTPMTQQLQPSCAASAAAAAPDRQQQHPAVNQQLQQLPPCLAMASKGVREAEQQLSQLPTPCLAPSQHKLETKRQQLKLQQPPQQLAVHDTVRQPWWKRLLVCQ